MDPITVFEHILSVMLQIAIIGLIGFFALRKGIIKESALLGLSRLVTEIAFPCYIFVHITKNIEIKSVLNLFWLPLGCCVLLFLGFILAWSYLKIDKKIEEKGEFTLLVTFHNAVYLPIPLIMSLFSQAQQHKMFLYLFAFNIPFSALLFTVGPHVLNRSRGFKFSWRRLFNNPVIAVLFSLFLAATGLHRYIPNTVELSLEMVSKITVPLVMMIIGGIILINYRAPKPAHPLTILKISFLKIIVIPFIVLGLILLFKIPYEFAVLFMIQACMPSASTLPLIARNENADYKLTGTTIFWSYLLSLITIPLFIALYFLSIR
ncbi:AEC family transporter [bacterium]|nr:AEC family transporter [bacterium]